MDNSNYTGLLIGQCVLITVALLVFFFALGVMWSFSAIHGNCKFFLLMTAVGQFCLILSHIFKVTFWFITDNYDRLYSIKQPFFKTFQPLNEFGYFLTDLNNFLLIIERTIACTRLRSSYEKAGTHWKIIIILEIICMAISGYFAFLIHFQGQLMLCIIIALSVEIVALVVLLLCYTYTKRAHLSLGNVGSRYQMREVEYVTRALLPACLITLLLRTLATASALFTVLFPFTIFPSYMAFMSTYSCIQTINSAQYGLVIVLIHETMRLKVKNMLLCLVGRGRNASPRIPALDKHKDNHRDAYFDNIKIMWE